jgi:hypothetical protein
MSATELGFAPGFQSVRLFEPIFEEMLVDRTSALIALLYKTATADLFLRSSSRLAIEVFQGL